jgi:glucose-1-phosphate thymidylyltransferase
MEIANNLNAVGKVFIQEQALGTAHAIQCAKESLIGPCVVAFADTLFKADFTLDANTDGAIWVKQVDEPSAYGVIKLSEGIITDFVEKPQKFVSDLAIIGIYYFKKGEILRDEIQYLLDNNIKEKGEFQLTNALENMKQKGSKFVPGKVNEWMDCGNKDITVETNSRVLQFAKQEKQNLVSKTVSLENSTIIEPCYIGENVKIKNATIGPNVSLGDNSEVENSTIENSLIQTNTKIINAKLNNAMIGNNAYFDGNFTSVSIGDFSFLI